MWNSGVWTLDGAPFKHEPWLGSCLSLEKKKTTCSQLHHLWLSKAVAWLQNKAIDHSVLRISCQSAWVSRLSLGFWRCFLQDQVARNNPSPLKVGTSEPWTARWAPRPWHINWGPEGVPRTTQTSTCHPGRALGLWPLLWVLLRAEPQCSGKISLGKGK